MLNQFKKAGASSQILKLLASFLIGRTMSVRIGQHKSAPRAVNAGAPQGSVLGTYIFNVGTDMLEEDCPRLEEEVPEVNMNETDWMFLETMTQDRHMSTPVRPGVPRCPGSPVDTTPIRGTQRIELLPRVKNPPLTRRIEPAWRHKKITVKKFVDDNLQAEKLQMKSALTYDQQGHLYKNVRASQSEVMFNHISRQAKEKGLLVNSKKTSLLAVSGARSYLAKAHIYDSDNTRIDSEETLKILGFVFNNNGTVNDQVESLVKKVNQRTWTLRELAKCGFSEQERVKVYVTMIRPILEYSSVVYSSMLTQDLDEKIEKVQIRALKNIYGHIYSRRQVLEMSGLETLRERREKACLKFANKMVNNPRFAGWFPKRRARGRTGASESFVEYPARTDRRRDSPLFYFRRLLNTQRVEYDVRVM